MKKLEYQYAIIGSGAAGSTAALMSSKFGKKTAIIEADHWGGSTLNYRDVPYAAALGFTREYANAIAGSRFGLASTNLGYNYPAILNWQATAVRRAGGGSKKVFENAGVDCFHGFAKFVSNTEVIVQDGSEEKSVTAEKFLIATGASLVIDGISGVENVSCWTPDTALRMSRLPRALFIVGAGSTGCELAQYFAALGVKVLLAEAKDRVLPREDPEVGAVMEQYLNDRFQVKVLTKACVVAVEESNKTKQVVFVQDGREKAVRVEAIVLATSSEPATDLDLEKAGVKFSRFGVMVDAGLKTTARNIWAAGDIVGGESSTEKAIYEAKLATMNALKKSNNSRVYVGFTRMTDTVPKVAKVGLNEIECAQIKQKQKSALVPLEQISASNLNDFKAGFVKLTADPKGQLLGATVVCPEADNVIQEIALGVRCGLKVTELAGTPHVANSWSEAIRVAARKLV